MTKTRAVNPWTWQEAHGYSQAIEVGDARRWLVCSGQASVDATGKAIHAGDFAAQLRQALDNLEAVLAEAALGLEHVVRLNYYVTDMKAFLEQSGAVLGPRFASLRSPAPTGTLLGVTALFHPDLMVEIEATACA
jgi:enamine deaminase RidA (YjgF/YER057c/UK114 family)